MKVQFTKKYNRYDKGEITELKGATLENALKRGVIKEIKEVKEKKAKK